MIIFMEPKAAKEAIGNVVRLIEGEGYRAEIVQGEMQATVHVIGIKDAHKTSLETTISAQLGVNDVKLVSEPFKIASKEFPGADKVVAERGNISVSFNGKNAVMMAGPCAVESEDQMMRSAGLLSALGIRIMRGGAYKPRSSPYDFQGLGEEGLKLARKAADKFGLLYVTEVLEKADLEIIAKYADIIQVGARNMQNFKLLEAVGQLDVPVMLKRGMNATIDEFLLSAEYILCQQTKHQVILCLRGIRTFEKDTRNTVDLGSLPVIKRRTWLPVVIDPSHAAGRRDVILDLTKMALAGDANGFMVEVHPYPEKALCDGKQSLSFREFADMYGQLADLGKSIGRTVQ